MLRLVLFFSILTFSKSLSAGFFFDPHVGTKILGDAKLLGRSFDHSQFEYGSKIGWHSGRTQLGFDLVQVLPTYKAQEGEPSEESFTGFQYGLFLGGRVGWFRGWVTWVIDATQTGDVNNEEYNGTGFEFGLSIGPQKIPNFFFKFSVLQFRTMTTSDGREIDLSNGQELETRALLIGVNWPINFGKSRKR